MSRRTQINMTPVMLGLIVTLLAFSANAQQLENESRNKQEVLKAPEPTATKLLKCGSKRHMKLMRKVFMGYLVEGRVSFDEIMALQSAPKDQQQGMVLEILERNNLPPLPECRKKVAASPPENTTSSFAATTPPSFNNTHQLSNISEEKIEEGMKILNLAVEKGFLPANIFALIGSNQVNIEELMRNLTGNRDFMIELLPDKIKAMAQSGKLDEKYIALFTSGKTKDEIWQVLMQDDAFFLQFLPSDLKDVLQNKPLPLWFKKGSMEENSTLQRDIFSNKTMCAELFGEAMCAIMEIYQNPTKKAIADSIDVMMYTLLVLIMLSIGLTIEYWRIMQMIRNPKAVLTALVAQFGIMPAAATGLAILFDLPLFGALTILLIGCSPGGNISNMLALAFQGDTNLSILMTSVSSVLGVGMMPLNLFIWSRFIVSARDSELMMPYTKIFISIVITLVPVLIGSLIRNYSPKRVKLVKQFGVMSVSLLSTTMIGLAIYVFKDVFLYLPLELVYTCSLLPLIGYITGFLIAKVAGEDNKSCRTIMVETGCQNGQLCVGVLRLSFNPMNIGVYYLVPMVYVLFQVSEVLLMIVFWKFCCLRATSSKIVEYKDDNNGENDCKLNSDKDDTSDHLLQSDEKLQKVS